jgi:hypothetical protein
MNCDGDTNARDIDGFVLALIQPAECLSAMPPCHLDRADLNGDSVIDARDLSIFVDALVKS